LLGLHAEKFTHTEWCFMNVKDNKVALLSVEIMDDLLLELLSSELKPPERREP